MNKTDEALKLAAEFDKRFTSMNGVDVPERVSVPRDEWRALHTAIQQALAAPVQPVAHCEQGPNFCKQCANQQAEDCAAILYRDHNEKPWVHVIQKDLPSGTKLIAVTKGQP
jgi:hypothetical protein